ncbi:tetratricopeptide repeat protein [Bermanella sp. R86510]|uniref:tetratricopeptide repeat protein n=1 Tax=unclassified Bermanella TaxID=2627862 RepID=UPI0037CAD542
MYKIIDLRYTFNVLLVTFMVFALSACSTAPKQLQDESQSTVVTQLPSWYSQELGYQVYGGNEYTQTPSALANLLRKADIAFIKQDYDRCQILLERAQRINSQDASVYVRLSYLAWMQNDPQLAIQMARRALVFVGDDQAAQQEIKRLIRTIEDRTYNI